MNIGYKLLREDGSSITEEHARIVYGKEWQEIPGNGAYIAYSGELWSAWGSEVLGRIVAEVEYEDVTNPLFSPPLGVVTAKRVRVLRWLTVPGCKAVDDYGEAFALSSPAYCDALDSAHRTYRASLVTAKPSDLFTLAKAHTDALVSAHRTLVEAMREPFLKMMATCKEVDGPKTVKTSERRTL